MFHVALGHARLFISIRIRIQGSYRDNEFMGQFPQKPRKLYRHIYVTSVFYEIYKFSVAIYVSVVVLQLSLAFSNPTLRPKYSSL